MSRKLIKLLDANNVKMPTIVGIFILLASESLKASNGFIFQHFSVMNNWNFLLSWVEHEKSFNNVGARVHIGKALSNFLVLFEELLGTLLVFKD